MTFIKPTLNTLLLVAVGFGSSWVRDARGQSVSDPASFVLPFIGTTNGGHVFPGKFSLRTCLYGCVCVPTSTDFRRDFASWNGQSGDGH